MNTKIKSVIQSTNIVRQYQRCAKSVYDELTRVLNTDDRQTGKLIVMLANDILNDLYTHCATMLLKWAHVVIIKDAYCNSCMKQNAQCNWLPVDNSTDSSRQDSSTIIELLQKIAASKDARPVLDDEMKKGFWSTILTDEIVTGLIKQLGTITDENRSGSREWNEFILQLCRIVFIHKEMVVPVLQLIASVLTNMLSDNLRDDAKKIITKNIQQSTLAQTLKIINIDVSTLEAILLGEERVQQFAALANESEANIKQKVKNNLRLDEELAEPLQPNYGVFLTGNEQNSN